MVIRTPAPTVITVDTVAITVAAPRGVVARATARLSRRSSLLASAMTGGSSGPPASFLPSGGHPPPAFRAAPRYLIWSYSENIGMYIAMTMKPTIAPTTMIMIGSMIAVSDLTAAAT